MPSERVRFTNSAGTARYPQYHRDMVRVGQGMYGYTTPTTRETFSTTGST